jgi:methylated-DNA-protein-cysteine methyltransferase-like protein
MKDSRSATFKERVLAIVAAVPARRVVTYGQVAMLAGRPRAAREVGWIAHAGGHGVPWHRVVNRAGGLATGYTDGRMGHRTALESEGVRVHDDYTVDLARYQWQPDGRVLARIGVIRAGKRG